MVRKEAPFDQINNEERKMIDIQLYKELKTQAEYLNTGNTTDSLFASYLDSLENTNIARIYRFNEKLELGDTLGAYSEVLNITPEFTPETNHKIVNEIYWRTWVNNIFEFSTADSLALYEVAEQHPHMGGTAVYDARVMLGLDFNDFEDGQQKSNFNLSEEDSFSSNLKLENKIAIYPNPAYLIINYEIELVDADKAQLVILDMMGRVVQFLELNSENLFGIMDISNLSCGIYHYEMRSDSGQTITGKIVVNK